MCTFVLPELDDKKAIENCDQLAHCDPLHGGYFCFDCYEKEIKEVDKRMRQEFFEDMKRDLN